MKKNKTVRPPVWAQRILAWYCREELLEDLQGDLNEYFDRNCKSKGPTRARLIYALDVVKFLRPYTIRKQETEVIVNQYVLKRFSIADKIPVNALGEILKVGGKEMKIIGVIKDFQYDKVNNIMAKEVILRYSNKEAEYLNVKIASTDLQATYAKIESI